jgi:eukaryotic-like serine/threonine-protein kinase
MAPPATIDAFLELVRKSGIVDTQQLDDYCGQLRQAGTIPDKVNRLARKMVQDGLLTTFQAEQYLRGKWRGFTIGNYRVLERLARGGMGTVYLAEHVSMPRRVAVKVLPSELAKNPMVVERFYREARAAAALEHPNLVRATDVDCEEGTHYLVMDFVEGVNLQELVDRKGPLSTARAANYIGQAACGLHHAHAVAGLVHRDIKPANVMLDRWGVARLLDMGLARMSQAGFFNAKSDEITKNYKDQNILGTADYIAPEQALNSQAADTRADIYSLGGTFHFLLSGQPPFPGGTLTQKLLWHQIKPPTPVRTLRPEVPEVIEALLVRMLAKDPAERPQTPGEVLEALAPWMETAWPPSDDEIVPLCAAAQPLTGGSSMSLMAGGPSGRLAKPARAEADTSTSDVPPADTEQSLPRQPSPAAVLPSRVAEEARPPAPSARPHRWQGRAWWAAVGAAAALAVAGAVWLLSKLV